jgi:hypothetical protein
MAKNNPWSSLYAATADKDLLLEPDVKDAVNRAFDPYQSILQRLINDSLDETTGCFGTSENDLAVRLVKAFDKRGRELTDYVKEQLSQTQGFVKTANDAAAALQAKDND